MIFGREPALWLGLIQVVIALILAFGVKLSMVQTAAIMAFFAALFAVIVRQNVASLQNLQERTPSTVASLNAQGIKVISTTPDKP